MYVHTSDGSYKVAAPGHTGSTRGQKFKCTDLSHQVVQRGEVSPDRAIVVSSVEIDLVAHRPRNTRGHTLLIRT